MTPEAIQALHSHQRTQVMRVCEKLGFEVTMTQAARGWSERPDHPPRYTAMWLRGLADQIHKGDIPPEFAGAAPIYENPSAYKALVVELCEQIGYGFVLHEAAYAWSTQPKRNSGMTAQWLRAFADELHVEEKKEPTGHWWIRFYTDSIEDSRPLKVPVPHIQHYWESGYSDTHAIMCAMATGETEAEVLESVKYGWPDVGELDFCDPRPEDWTPGDRFPLNSETA